MECLFHLPSHDPANWHFVLDTARPDEPEGRAWPTGTYPLAARSVAILRHSAEEEDGMREDERAENTGTAQRQL